MARRAGWRRLRSPATQILPCEAGGSNRFAEGKSIMPVAWWKADAWILPYEAGGSSRFAEGKSIMPVA